MPDTEAPRQMAIRGIHHLTLISRDLAATTSFYRDLLGLVLAEQVVSDDDPEAQHAWFDTGGGQRISFLEYAEMSPGVVGVGSTHHIALAVDTPDELDAWRTHLAGHGVACSDRFDRHGFASIYFRDPDGHLVELATSARGPR